MGERTRRKCAANKRRRENRTVKATKIQILTRHRHQCSSFLQFDSIEIHYIDVATHMYSVAQSHTNNRTGAGVGGGGGGGIRAK